MMDSNANENNYQQQCRDLQMILTQGDLIPPFAKGGLGGIGAIRARGDWDSILEFH